MHAEVITVVTFYSGMGRRRVKWRKLCVVRPVRRRSLSLGEGLGVAYDGRRRSVVEIEAVSVNYRELPAYADLPSVGHTIAPTIRVKTTNYSGLSTEGTPENNLEITP